MVCVGMATTSSEVRVLSEAGDSAHSFDSVHQVDFFVVYESDLVYLVSQFSWELHEREDLLFREGPLDGYRFLAVGFKFLHVWSAYATMVHGSVFTLREGASPKSDSSPESSLDSSASVTSPAYGSSL